MDRPTLIIEKLYFEKNANGHGYVAVHIELLGIKKITLVYNLKQVHL